MPASSWRGRRIGSFDSILPPVTVSRPPVAQADKVRPVRTMRWCIHPSPLVDSIIERRRSCEWDIFSGSGRVGSVSVICGVKIESVALSFHRIAFWSGVPHSSQRHSRRLPAVYAFFRRFGHPAFRRIVRRTIQHDEFSNLPSEGRLLAPLGLLLVSRLAPLGRRSSVNLPPVPRGRLRSSGLSRERVEASQRATADDDTDRLWRWRFRAPSFLSSLRVFAPHYRLIGSYGLQLADSDWRPSSAAVHVIADVPLASALNGIV